jgi:hypothetical protein
MMNLPMLQNSGIYSRGTANTARYCAPCIAALIFSQNAKIIVVVFQYSDLPLPKGADSVCTFHFLIFKFYPTKQRGVAVDVEFAGKLGLYAQRRTGDCIFAPNRLQFKLWF